VSNEQLTVHLTELKHLEPADDEMTLAVRLISGEGRLTASVHVSNILAKLNVASRGEAAAVAHRLHLFG
jgi:hypothetical protein